MANTELGTINTAPSGGTTPVQDSTYQSYSYTFTAGQGQEYLSLLFRNDPGYTWLDDVSVVDTTTDAQVLTDGGFESGPIAGTAPPIPVGWAAIGTQGLPVAGSLGTATGNIDQAALAKPFSGTYFWVDGATGGYDGLTQQMTLTAGSTYTLSFELAVDPDQDPDTSGDNAGINTEVFVGATPESPCFLRGTRILTLRGEVPVEALAMGDLVVTCSGQGDVLKPIHWIGRSPFDASRHPHPLQVQPIRIRAGALGEGLPRRDLVVSPGHSLLLDGVLIQAERLVNGATIVREGAATSGEYFHVELRAHDILVSEGVPSESYLDTGNRGGFVNGGGPVDLHPDFSPRHWTETCVALVLNGPALVAVRARLIDRAIALGWRYHTEREPILMLGNRALPPVSRHGGWTSYDIPGAATLRLLSASGVPAELLPQTQDPRRLGLMVDGIALVQGAARTELALDDPALTDGWHGTEHAADTAWRWTNGDASIDLPGPCRLELSIPRCAPAWRLPTVPLRDSLAG